MSPRGRTSRTASARGPHRRPRLGWETASSGQAPTAAELEADAVAVLVRLLEWAPYAGVDFEAALRRARKVETERLQGPAR
jgi:hypothetical protein